MNNPFTGLTCILCGKDDCLSLDLDDLKTIRCRECEDEFTTEAVAEHIAKWQSVMAWVGMASTTSETPATLAKSA